MILSIIDSGTGCIFREIQSPGRFRVPFPLLWTIQEKGCFGYQEPCRNVVKRSKAIGPEPGIQEIWLLRGAVLASDEEYKGTSADPGKAIMSWTWNTRELSNFSRMCFHGRQKRKTTDCSTSLQSHRQNNPRKTQNAHSGCSPTNQ